MFQNIYACFIEFTVLCHRPLKKVLYQFQFKSGLYWVKKNSMCSFRHFLFLSKKDLRFGEKNWENHNLIVQRHWTLIKMDAFLSSRILTLPVSRMFRREVGCDSPYIRLLHVSWTSLQPGSSRKLDFCGSLRDPKWASASKAVDSYTQEGREHGCCNTFLDAVGQSSSIFQERGHTLFLAMEEVLRNLGPFEKLLHQIWKVTG